MSDKTTSYSLKKVHITVPSSASSRLVQIVCQNENGPCPLLALSNALIIRGELNLPPSSKSVTSQHLTGLLADIILSKSSGEQESVSLDEVLGILPKLSTGLDVNVRFDAVDSFEVNPQLLVFSMLNVHLYHAWIPDMMPQDTDNTADNYREELGGGSSSSSPSKRKNGDDDQIVKQSYNSLVDGIIRGKEASDQLAGTTEALHDTKTLTAQVETGLRYSEFLDNCYAQLTMKGLSQLGSVLNGGDIIAFFRNNHFSTVYKHITNADTQEYLLLQLVTDLGYLEHDNFVWETLNDVTGDSQFLDGNYQPVLKRQAKLAEHSRPDIDADFALALQLQESDSRADMPMGERELTDPEPPVVLSSREIGEEIVTSRVLEGERAEVSEDADFALALKLQQEEEEAAIRHQQQEHAQDLEQAEGRKSPDLIDKMADKCVIS